MVKCKSLTANGDFSDCIHTNLQIESDQFAYKTIHIHSMAGQLWKIGIS